jgi:NAD(P)-dependent dehydrogenase (short-subunit alcohol dehydrogenase family)
MPTPRRKAPTVVIFRDARKTMQPKRSDSNRRSLFASLASGMPGPAAGNGAAAAATLTPMFDYSRSPFPRQSPPPVLASGIKLKLEPHVPATADRASGRLLGRRALIVGGDSAAGRAAAIAFAEQGADVAFNYLPAEQADAHEVAQLVDRAGRKALLLPGDPTDEYFCRQLVADTVRALGGLDILVSIASRRYVGADIADMSTAQFDAAFKSNIYAMFWLTKAALPHMGPGSSIINTSTPTGGGAADILLDYSATKGAIMVFTKALAKQLASRGIRVNAVAPEPLWTPLPTGDDPPAGERAAARSGGATARCGRQAELASTLVLLASNESSYATGQLFGAVGDSSA